MKILLPFMMILLTHGCVKKSPSSTTDDQMIERDMDILNEEDLEELPET